MGKATRWLKGLLGMKKDKEIDQMEQCSSNSPVLSDKKEKKRWSFGKSSLKDANEIPQMPTSSPRNVPTTVDTDVAWLRSPYSAETVNEQNKHAIAVAAATAAAADAAVAAAQAAMAVVRLTSNGRGTLFGGARERWAAMKIQTVFRGYLSRKALRALKGLVRLQAIVRGYLVRKRTTATLHSMQALIRAQTAVRSQRIFRSFKNKESRHWPENRPRKSIERFDEPRNEIHSKRLSASMEVSPYDDSPRIVEIDTFKTRSRSRRFNFALSECEDDLPCQNQTISSTPHCQNLHDFEWCFATAADDECRLSTTQSTPRFGECRLSTAQSTPRLGNTVRSNAPATPARSVCGDAYFKPYLPNYMANTQSFKAKLRSHSAPKQRPEPGGGAKKRLSLNEVIGARNSISGVRMNRSCYQLKEANDERRLSTAQSTPRFGECKLSTAQSTPRFGKTVRSNAPATQTRSVCGDAYFKPYLLNYMAKTQSFKAKLKSHNAPKQRPEPGGGAKKRLSLNEVIGARNSISGVRMNRSCYQLEEGLEFGD